jgi:hypothetical protein
MSMLARRVRTRRLASLLTVALALAALGRPFLLCAGMAHSVLAAPAAHAAHHGGHSGNTSDQRAPKHEHGLDECCTICASACGGLGAGAASLAALSAPTAVRTIRPPRDAALPPAERPRSQPFPIGPPAPLVV